MFADGEGQWRWWGALMVPAGGRGRQVPATSLMPGAVWGQADAAQECPFLRDQDLRALLPLVRAVPQWQNHVRGKGSGCGGGRCRWEGTRAQGPKAGLGGAAPGLGGERRRPGVGGEGCCEPGFAGWSGGSGGLGAGETAGRVEAAGGCEGRLCAGNTEHSRSHEGGGAACRPPPSRGKTGWNVNRHLELKQLRPQHCEPKHPGPGRHLQHAPRSARGAPAPHPAPTRGLR